MATVASASKASARKRANFAPYSNVPTYVAVILLGAVVIVPIAYVALSGFRTTGQLAFDPVSMPHPWVTHNYTNVLTSREFWRQLGNSAIIAAVATALVSRWWIGVLVGAAVLVAPRLTRGRLLFAAGAPVALAVGALLDRPELGWVALGLLVGDLATEWWLRRREDRPGNRG